MMDLRRIRRARHAVLYLLALCAALTVGGCDALGRSGSTYRGVVVDAETGAPIEGIHVSLQEVTGIGFRAIVEAGFTDQDGEFRLRTTEQATKLYVNDPACYGDPCPINPDYSGVGPVTRQSGEMRIELTPRTP